MPSVILSRPFHHSSSSLARMVMMSPFLKGKSVDCEMRAESSRKWVSVISGLELVDQTAKAPNPPRRR